MKRESIAAAASTAFLLVMGLLGLFLVVFAQPPWWMSVLMTVGPLVLACLCFAHYRETRELERDDTP